jgi:transcriptional regulator with XRE-family HTH domain
MKKQKQHLTVIENRIATCIRVAMSDHRVNFTNESFAKALGVHRNSIIKWKTTGRVKAADLYRIAKIINTRISFFFPE